MDDDAIRNYGRTVIQQKIEMLEQAEPGWCPTFYVTGYYKEDLAEAERLRAMIGEPRPQEVIDRHIKLLKDFDADLSERARKMIEEGERRSNRWFRRLGRWLRGRIR